LIRISWWAINNSQVICVTFDQKCGNAEKMASGGGGGGGKAVGKEEYHGGLSTTHIVLSNHK
jgi:hypothetical protein